MFVQEQFIDVVVQMSSKKIGVKLGKVDKSETDIYRSFMTLKF